MQGREVLAKGGRWNIGDGSSITIANDNWLGSVERLFCSMELQLIKWMTLKEIWWLGYPETKI